MLLTLLDNIPHKMRLYGKISDRMEVDDMTWEVMRYDVASLHCTLLENEN